MPHYENEAPFEVPKSWEWIQIKDVCEVARGGSPRPIKDYLTNDPSGVNWIKIGDTTKDGKYIDSAKEKIKIEGVRKSRIVHKGDFLLTNSMSFGRPYILRIDGCIHDGWLVISPMSNSYQSDFLYYLLSSIFAYEQFSKVASGGVVTNLNSDKVADSFFPLPPYKEQIRIVEEIEKWFALIDTLESAKEDLRTSISQAKSKILDLAIHGKLVPQDPNDEPAIELLKRINPKFTPCDNAHYPFDVPSSWAWATGSDIFKPLKTASPIGDTFNYIDIDAIDNKRNVITAVKVIKTKQAPSRASRYTEKGCVLFSMVRPYLRNIAMVSENDCIASTGFFVCQAESCLSPKFCYYLMLSNYVVDGLNNFMKGDNSPSITKGQIESFVFPLPPHNEQLRIVAKIEEIFAVLDEIQKSIEA